MADGAVEVSQSPADITSVAGIVERLAARGLMSASEGDHAIAVAEQSGEPFDQAACKLGLIEEHTLAAFFAAEFGLRLINAAEMTFDASVLGDVNLTYCDYHRVLPFCAMGDGVAAVIVDPLNARALDGLAFSLNQAITPFIVTASQFDQLIEAARFSARGAATNEAKPSVTGDIDRLKDMASTEPVVKFVNRLILDASELRASDIHLEPSERLYNVRYRVDGVLRPMNSIDTEKAMSVVSRLKILCHLDIAERRRPQDGGFSFPVAGRKIDLRVSSTPTVNGESMVIRLLDKASAPQDLETLGFNAPHRRALSSLISKPNGIVLITGPTGSGKTTTLYTLLSQLADGRRKILTIEDPVEHALPGANQTQVNPQIGLTFASGLRAFLRHDPDVIMVGEMRDLETARIAVQAALTGHLVLSTLHTNDAPSAITRLVDMGIEDYLIASTVTGVAAQRLVPRICAACGGTGLDGANACAACDGARRSGRIAVAEVLEIDDAVQRAIKHGATAQDIKSAAARQQFRTMVADGQTKAEQRLVSQDDIDRIIGILNG
ncbi:MAG: GspE/PulE family protein [Pseudomonadota bacterium]